MSYFKSTRTVKTIYSDGTGPPRTETKTYRYGSDDGPNVGFSTDNGMPSQFKIGFGNKGYKIRLGGGGGGGDDAGGDQGGDGGSRWYRPSTRLEKPTQRPQVVGRSTRKESKNPFAGVKNQNFEQIKKMCKEQNCLFEDPEFEASDYNIFFSKQPPRSFEWKRPGEICENPEFISEGTSRFDVQQGELGDCWLLAAVASLTCNHQLMKHVVPPEQNFTDDYCGVFKFNFWHQGEWIEVCVDDRLPTYYSQLVFMHSTEKNEFWSALLEKAYAKLQGSYESLKGGSTSEAMEDFTGGVTESVDLQKAPDNLFSIMLKASARGSLMGCSIDADPNQLEARLANGLVMGHAYSITAVNLIDIETPRSSGKIPLVRIRNPWGNEAEWKGAWSDQSAEWNFIPEDQRQEMGLNFDDDGEFWMSFRDFASEFQKLEICNLGPDSLDEEEAHQQGKVRWEATSEHGEWIPGVNAGGCRNYLDTFWTNPQYRVTLTDPDEDEDDLCTILVGVLQKDRRKKRKEGLDLLTMGYVIYKLTEESHGPLDVKFFKYNASVAKSPSFINMREICGRHKLSPGTYCIIPSTFEPHNKGEYLMRIFTEKANVTQEMDEETSFAETQPWSGRGSGGYIQPQYAQRDYMSPQYIQSVSSAPLRGAPPPAQAQARGQAVKGRDAKEPTEEEVEQEEALKKSFKRVAGEDMEIDAFELKDILNAVFTREFKFDGFNIDTCRSMVAMHDGDLSGRLGYDEFKCLWTDLRKWKGVFKEFDHDKSGHLSSYELRAALHASGFKLSNRTFSALVMRYSNKEGILEFGDFIVCAIRLKTMLASFRNAEQDGVAVFDVDDFIQTTMYS